MKFKKIMCVAVSTLLIGTMANSIYATNQSIKAEATVEPVSIEKMRLVTDPLPFEFEVISYDSNKVVAKFISLNKINEYPYLAVKGTKAEAEKTTAFDYILEYSKEYSFVYNCTLEGNRVVYNAVVIVEQDNDGNINVIIKDIIQNIIPESISRATETRTESESNNSYGLADRTYDDYDNYGAINLQTDVDWWVVSFSESGNANFWLGNIPSNCDFDITLYASDGTTQLASSANGGNDAELITFPVEANEDYYVKIHSFTGSSTSQYLFRAKNYSFITSGNVYRFKNAASGKYLNVHYGYDANYTNVYQFPDDESVELTFRVVYENSLDAYYIYPMCSSNGRSRVLDIYNTSGLAAGCNVQIYNKNSATSDQTFDIISVGNDKYKIVMASNNNLALAAYGTSDGSGTGTSATSAGNVYLATYTGTTYQQWYIEAAEDNHEDYYNGLGWNYMFSDTAGLSYISCDYGPRENPFTGNYEFHTGIDLPSGGVYGINIYPVEDGKVVHIIEDLDTSKGRGYGIIIEHDDTVYGSTQKLRTMYIHMQSLPLKNLNNDVYVNEVIGKVGSTGASTGPHLHFTVISDGSVKGHNIHNTIEPMFFYMNRVFTYDQY